MCDLKLTSTTTTSLSSAATMYSTDDDLFSRRRVSKKWRRLSCNKSQETSAVMDDVKRMSSASDESSDDFANATDLMWIKQQQQNRRGQASAGRQRLQRRVVHRDERAVDDNVCDSSESSDFEYTTQKGRALLERNAKKERQERIRMRQEDDVGARENAKNTAERCSSCSESICDRIVRSPKQRTNKLLEKFACRTHRPVLSTSQKEKAAKDSGRIPVGTPDTTLQTMLKTIRSVMLVFRSDQNDLASQRRSFIKQGRYGFAEKDDETV